MEKRWYKAELLLKHDRGLGPVFKKTIYLEAENIIDAQLAARDKFREEYGANLYRATIFIESMRYYPNTIAEIHKRLMEKFPDAVPERNLELDKKDPVKIPGHMLWLMENMQNFKKSKKKTAKAGRWIAWVEHDAHDLGLMKHEEIRRLTEKDSDEGYI